MDADFEGISFENTRTQAKIFKYYSVTGAEPIRKGWVQSNKDIAIKPLTVMFTFEDGDPTDMVVSGRAVLRNGDLAATWQKIHTLYIWNQQEWPAWLTYLYKLACHDLEADRLARV